MATSTEMEIIDDNGDSLGLPEIYSKIPLTALRVSVRRVTALYLDEQADIVNEDTGRVGDYGGLAELVGFTYLEIKSFARQKSPTKELLEEWETRDSLEPTIGNLWSYLRELGRFDVMKDCKFAIIKDVEAYLRNKEREQDQLKPLQSNTVSQSDSDQSADHHVHEDLILCKEDVENKTPQFFDAFVCYNPEGQDLTFVKEMIKILEGPEHKLKLFVPYRDDLPGGAKHVIDAKLIESRCKRMIIILSSSYLKSSACDFQVKFAHALSPGARSKKLIPVLIEPIKEIPQILRHVTLCDYTKLDLQVWFWHRLSNAVRQPLDPVASGYGAQPSPAVSLSSSLDSGFVDSNSVSDLAMDLSGHSDLKSEWEEISHEDCGELESESMDLEMDSLSPDQIPQNLTSSGEDVPSSSRSTKSSIFKKLKTRFQQK